MSSGKAHARASLRLARPAVLMIAGPTFAVTLGDILTTAFVAVGAWLGCAILGQILSSDLDKKNWTYSELLVLKKGGPFAGLFLTAWWPYAKVFRHRSPWSHLPILGTAIRLLYTWIIALGLLALIGELDESAKSWFAGIDWVAFWTHPVAIGTVWGLLVSDAAHWWMDIRSTRKKRRAGRKRQQRWI